MTDIPQMAETDNPLEDARKYLVDYTEAYRNDAAAERDLNLLLKPLNLWKHFEVLSLTIQDLLEHVQKLQDRIDELEKN